MNIYINTFILFFTTLAYAQNSEQNQHLPKYILNIQKNIEGKSSKDAYEITKAILGTPNRDIGSGFSIQQWDLKEGTFTFHEIIGPSFRKSNGRKIYLLTSPHKVKMSVFSGYEMYSLPSQDPHNNGSQYWLGNIELNPNGEYTFKDSGQFSKLKVKFPKYFFQKNTTGKFKIQYHPDVKPDDLLENLTNNSQICSFIF
jgi:hypothetical protein